MYHHTFSLSLAWFGDYFQRVTTRYRQIYKKMYMNIFFKKELRVTHGNPLQIVPKPWSIERKRKVTQAVLC